MRAEWQSDWVKFAQVLSDRILAGDTTEMLAERFGGKQIAWEGTLTEKDIDDIARAVTVSMKPVTIHLRDYRTKVIDLLSLPIAKDAINSWRILRTGSKIVFIASFNDNTAVFPPLEVKYFPTDEYVVIVRLNEGRPLHDESTL